MKLTPWMKNLPVMKHINHIIETILDNDVTILTSPTGSGKSVIIPQAVATELGAKVVVTQPRVVNSISLAKTIKESYPDVGYHTKLESSNKAASLLYATDFSVVNMLQSGNYPDVLIMDEFHERNTAIELLVTLYKNKELPFKLVIMSATMDTTSLSRYFNNAPVIDLEGNTHEMEEITISESSWYDTILEEYHSGKTVVVFEPGKGEIEASERTLAILDSIAKVIPVHSEAGNAREVVADNYPKILLATNAIETGVTIGGDIVVFDTQLHRELSVRNGVNELTKKEISQFSARQRRGRSGRTSAGKYYSVRPISSLTPNDSPDIERLELADSYLYFAMHNMDLAKLELLANVSTSRIEEAIKTLEFLGFLKDGVVTPDGKRASRYSQSVREAKTLMVAESKGLNNNVAIALAIVNNELKASLASGTDDIIIGVKSYQSIVNTPHHLRGTLEYNKAGFKRVNQAIKRYKKRGIATGKPYDVTKHQETVDCLQYTMSVIYSVNGSIDTVFNYSDCMVGRDSNTSVGTGFYVGSGFTYRGRTYYNTLAKLSEKATKELVEKHTTVVRETVNKVDTELETVIISTVREFNSDVRISTATVHDFSDIPSHLVDTLDEKLALEYWKDSKYYSMKPSEVDSDQIGMVSAPFGTSPITGKEYVLYLYTDYLDNGRILVKSTLDKEYAEKRVLRTEEAMNPVIISETTDKVYIEKDGYPTDYPIKEESVVVYNREGSRNSTYLRKTVKITKLGIKSTGEVLLTDKEVIAIDIPFPQFHVTEAYPYANNEIAEVERTKVRVETNRTKLQYLRERREVLVWLLGLGVKPKTLLPIYNGRNIQAKYSGIEVRTEYNRDNIYIEDGYTRYIEKLGDMKDQSLVIGYDTWNEIYHIQLVDRVTLPNTATVCTKTLEPNIGNLLAEAFAGKEW